MGPGVRRGSDGGWVGVGPTTSIAGWVGVEEATSAEGRWDWGWAGVGETASAARRSALANRVLPQGACVPVEGFAIA